MLFARFLAENHLLMHPSGVAVSLEECEELAASERAPNGYVLAARYASRMLPQIFRIDDVLLDIEFAPEQRLALERLLASLPRETFLAADSLGWVYQFWQTKRKDEVNKSGDKIDGRTLPAVTQLFTEDYMVQFLLHNTIGAWWCARREIAGPPGGAGVPAAKSPVAMEYLRWKDDGTPAAGSFDGWPRSLREFTMLDPCCGSGHFLVAAFRLLVPLRMRDEGLSARDACDAVLRENLFGLELDPRCTQIAAFALALAAWTYPGPDGEPLGYRPLPTLNIACSGQGVVGRKEDWAEFAGDDGRFREGMQRLYDLFLRAPDLGSLLDPRTVTGDLFALGFDTLKGTVERALKKIEARDDPERAVLGVAAQGIALASSLMARVFTLVATNVPYLTRGRQDENLRAYLEEIYPTAKADLATAFLERCLSYCETKNGTAALVMPQNWLFLKSYQALRSHHLAHTQWIVVARLGAGAFEMVSGEVVNVALFAMSRGRGPFGSSILGLDVSHIEGSRGKGLGLIRNDVVYANQIEQLKNPDARFLLDRREFEGETRLESYADSFLGLGTGDYSHYGRLFWELKSVTGEWSRQQGSIDRSILYGGRENVIFWNSTIGRIHGMSDAEREQIHNQDQSGRQAWGRTGIAVSLSRELFVTSYTGEVFDKALAAIVPRKREHLMAIWAFCNSTEFGDAVRRLDKKTIVANGTLVKVPFNLERWQSIASSKYPNGFPQPESDDPTQWLFKGHPRGSTDPLQVAVARLLGYHWPDQVPDSLDALADADGIVPIPAVRSDDPAAGRLREVLRIAFGSEWSASMEDRLQVESGAKSYTTLDDWLRNEFFEQHCKRFHNRPSIWHIWDGRRDGFSVLVNYHTLDHKALENLTYSYLGGWITAQSRSDSAGADLRLAAAQALQENLKRILAGEPPHDIFVRWKPLSEQAIGWNPDLNDGVRMNIRPFVEAGILRKPPNIKWTKDRGNEPQRPQEEYPWFWPGGTFKGDRVNDVHLTIAQKQAARKK